MYLYNEHLTYLINQKYFPAFVHRKFVLRHTFILSKGTRQKKNVENSTLGLTKGGPFGEKKLVEKNMV